MYPSHKNRLLAVLCLFGILFVNGQYTKLKFDHVSLPASVSTNQVNCFLETEEGFLWMGSRGGLIRFDGYKALEIKNIDKEGNVGSFGHVNTIIRDDFGIIWIGGQGGVYRYNPLTGLTDEFTKLKLKPQDECRILYKTRANNIVIGTTKGFYVFNPGTDTITHYKHRSAFKQSLSSNIIRCVFEDSQGYIWIGTYDKLNRLEPKTGMIKRYKLKPQNDATLLQNNLILSISEITINQKKRLLVGTETGLVLFDTETDNFEVFKQGKGKRKLSNSVIKTIQVVADNEVWLGTDMGLNIFNPVERTFRKYYANYNNSYTISNNIIHTVFKDSKGNVWLGTNNGIDKAFVSNGNFFRNQLSEGAPYIDKSVQVTSVAQDKEGNHWFATSEGFCCYNEHTKKYEWFRISDILNTKIRDIIVDKRGQVWLATPQGLHIYFPKSKTFQSYYSDVNNVEALQTNYIQTVFEDELGNIWVGTFKGGLFKVKDPEAENLSFVNVDDLLSEQVQITRTSINSIVQGTKNTIWICTSLGVKELNVITGELQQIITNLDYIPVIHVENERYVWYVENNAIMKLDVSTSKKEFVSEVPKDVRAWLFDKDKIWFSTFRNLYHIKKDGTELKQVSNKVTQMDNYAWVSYKNNQGDLIFGGANGFICFNPAEIEVDNTVNPVQFTNLNVLGEVVAPYFSDHSSILDKNINNVDELAFEYAQNTFSLEFSTLNYKDQENEKYTYILEGYEKEWQVISGKNPEASFTRVKPGNYVFRVKSANSTGGFSEEGRRMHIVVHPPLWASNWAITIYILLFLVILIYSKHLLVTRVNDKNNLEFEKKQRVKTDELIRSKTRFFTNISHELKTPLTLIFSPTERLLKEETDPKKIATLEIIKRNTERLIRLVNQMLDVRKIETGMEKLNLENYDLVGFTKRLTLLFEEEAAYRNVQLKFASEVENLEMKFDMTKVEKIIFNLISNAFKFTQDHGKIKVKINVVKKNAKDFACIQIKDSGIGISEENQKRIFERFTNVNTKNYTSQEGTGIGLSLVSDYVELHKGFVKLNSKVDKGSAFSIFLPLEVASEVENVTAAKGLGELDMEEADFESEEEKLDADGKLKLLVIEDDRDMRSFISSSFSDEFQVSVASDGEEGYQKTFLNHPDIIISDVMMPKMDGITLCKKLKKDVRTSHIPIILLTAKGGNVNKMEGISVGAEDYIQKPFHLDYLILRTNMLLSKREKVQKEYLNEEEVSVSEITTNPVDERFLNELMAVIDKNLDNSELSVHLLAELLQLDKTSLYRKVKSLTGQTATAFIRHTRLKKAAYLLKSDKLNISEVMYMVGYTHRSYFTRSFKELYGMVPTEYKTKKGE